jgi:hypothetical protein
MGFRPWARRGCTFRVRRDGVPAFVPSNVTPLCATTQRFAKITDSDSKILRTTRAGNVLRREVLAQKAGSLQRCVPVDRHVANWH